VGDFYKVLGWGLVVTGLAFLLLYLLERIFGFEISPQIRSVFLVPFIVVVSLLCSALVDMQFG
jgi:ABC-type sulfate transport system permease subunit